MIRLQKLADLVRLLTNRTDHMTVDSMAFSISQLSNASVPADKAILERTASFVVIPSNITAIHKNMFKNWEGNLTDIFCMFAEGTVSGAPWGAPSTTKIHYMVEGD